VRKKLSITEKELSRIIFEQTGGNQDFALIRSKGDQELFSQSTQSMKAQWKVPEGRPFINSHIMLMHVNSISTHSERQIK
jgi:hypothetical protein